MSADSAPSRGLWNRLAALYSAGSVVCATCSGVYVSERKILSRLFRMGVNLFAWMNWASNVGYTRFPLADSGKEIAYFREVKHMAVTIMMVVFSIASLVCLIVNGCRDRRTKGIGAWAAPALL